MAQVGNSTTPTHNWFEQGVNTPPNQVATSYTMPAGGGTVTQLFAYYGLVAGGGATAFNCMWNSSGTLLSFWSGAVALGSASAGGQAWNGGNTNAPVFVAGGTTIWLGFAVQQANGFFTSDESSGSSSWDTVAPGSAPGSFTSTSSTGHNAIGSYAVYTPGEMWIWNGSAWVGNTVQVWNGSAWASPTGIFVWNGSAWVNAT